MTPPPPTIPNNYMPGAYQAYDEIMSTILSDDSKMADKAVSKQLSKPEMRGLLNNVIKKNLMVGIALAIASGVAFKLSIGDVRKRRYAEFYRTYDAEKDFEEMRAKGLFQSC